MQVALSVGSGRVYILSQGDTDPAEVRALLEAPNFVHFTTLRADGTPRNWVVWVDLVDDLVLVCTGIDAWKAKDMVRDDTDGKWMDAISMKYTGKPFPMRGEGRVCFAISVEKAGNRTLGFTSNPRS